MSTESTGADGAQPPNPDTKLLCSDFKDRFPVSLPGAALTSGDLESLKRVGTDRTLAERALLRCVDSFTGAQIVGRSGNGDYTGILIPYIWPGEQRVREYRLRRDRPEIE